MSFPLLMVLLVAITGVVWLVDALFLVKKRRAAGVKEPAVVEYSRAFFPIILAVLVIRSFIVEPFRIPSGSMLPTLHIGDFILVNKFAYGVRLPVSHTRIIETGTPQRGDVMVFRFPQNPKIDYIKRVIGLPGDTIGYFDKTVHVNGKPVTMTAAPRDGSLKESVPATVTLFREQLGDVAYDIFHDPRGRPFEKEFIVPAGEYFMMGDNRDHSNDSRYWGTVPEANLVGKAFRIWMSWDNGVVWNRMGNKI